MSAPLGNRFWEQRSSHGRKPIFESADALWDAACEYFEWVQDNPLNEKKLFSYEGDIVEGDIDKMRAMTIQGLCFFLDISRQAYYNYKERKDFVDICERIEAVIYTQKFEGASAGLLNSAIIARELGLAEKQDHTSSDGSMGQKPTTINLVGLKPLDE